MLASYWSTSDHVITSQPIRSAGFAADFAGYFGSRVTLKNIDTSSHTSCKNVSVCGTRGLVLSLWGHPLTKVCPMSLVSLPFFFLGPVAGQRECAFQQLHSGLKKKWPKTIFVILESDNSSHSCSGSISANISSIVYSFLKMRYFF